MERRRSPARGTSRRLPAKTTSSREMAFSDTPSAIPRFHFRRRTTMRRALLALPLVLAACSQPEYFEMKPAQVSMELRGETKQIRPIARDRRGNEYPTYKPDSWES